MNLKNIIEVCVNYIEDNIHNKITLDDLSKETNVSKYYLHRIFKSLTGESIIEYVQSRKLTLSIDELVNTNKRIIDISMDFGFNHEQSYIRAFKKKFGYTPLKIRSENISIILTEKINSDEILTIENSITYKPFFVFKQGFYIIGSEHKILSKSGDNDANSYGLDFFYNKKDIITNSINPHIYIGYTNWSKNSEGYIYYMPSVQVKDLKNIPKGMKGIAIPPHEYVVFKFVGFFKPDYIKGKHIGRILAHLYRRWIYKSNFKFSASYRLEYIDNSLSKDNYCELHIYQPVERI